MPTITCISTSRSPRITALLAVLAMCGAFVAMVLSPVAASAARTVRNSAIADRALSYDGQWGAKASVDAGAVWWL